MRSTLPILVAVVLSPCALAQRRDVDHTMPSRKILGQALLAAVWADDLRGVEAALGRGADVNHTGAAYDPQDGARVRERTTALILASERGDLPMARLLLSRGARPNLRDENGNTALHEATDEGHPALVSLLLQRGADYRLRNHFGLTALDFTKRPDQVASLEASRSIARTIGARMANDREKRRKARKPHPQHLTISFWITLH